MVTRSVRRFQISDAMVLIVGMAVGLTLIRHFSPKEYLIPYSPGGMEFIGDPIDRLPLKFQANWALTTVLGRFGYVSPLIATMTLAVLALRFRHPQPGLIRLTRQPGTVAGLASATGLGISAIGIIILLMKQNQSDQDPFFMPSFVMGTAVAVAWIILAIGGRWRPERSWIDRAGFALGLLWISFVVIHLIRLSTL